MNIRQLEIFLAVADHRSMTQAAKHLFISQPAVSNAIRDLEAGLGLTLFDRRDNRLTLNPTGVAFRAQATQLLEAYTALGQFGQRQVAQLPLRVGTSLTLGEIAMPQAVNRFKARFPDVTLTLLAENVARIKRRLINGDIDVAFIEGYIPQQAYTATRLAVDELYLVAAPTFAAQPLTPERLATVPFLLREPGSTLRDVFDATMHALDQAVEPYLQSANTSVLQAAAVAGLGVTVLPKTQVHAALAAKHLVRLPLPGKRRMETPYYAVTLAHTNRGEQIDALIAAFKQTLNN